MDIDDAAEDSDSSQFQKLQAISCTFSQLGVYSSINYRTMPNMCISWNTEHLKLLVAEGSATQQVSIRWSNLWSIWTSVRVKSGEGFVLDLAFDTTQGDLDFMRFRVLMDGAAGHLLQFLQDTKSDRLKEDRAPSWVMSRWACPLYARGVTSNKLRVWLGWTSTFFEVLFAVSFLLQLHGILLSREGKLVQIIAQIASNFKNFHNFSTMVLLLQQLATFMVIFRSLWSTINAALRSLLAFHKAGLKTQKTIRKRLGSMGSQPSKNANLNTDVGIATGTGQTSGDGSGRLLSEEGLRQRTIA